MRQPSRFDTTPEGLRHRPGLITADQELALIAALERLPLRPFQFHDQQQALAAECAAHAGIGWHRDRPK
jgi:hypothetical protein